MRSHDDYTADPAVLLIEPGHMIKLCRNAKHEMNLDARHSPKIVFSEKQIGTRAEEATSV